MQKVLIVTRHTPLPWEDGAGAYLHDVARFLATQRCRVDLLWLAPHEHLRWARFWRLPAAFDETVHLSLPESVRFGRWVLFPSVVWLPFKANIFDRVRRVLRVFGINPPRRSAKFAAAPIPSTSTTNRPWASPPTAGELDLVQRFAKKHNPDVIIASYAWMCPLLDVPALRHTRSVCVTHDIGWQRAALAATPSTPPDITRVDEQAWLRRAGLIVAISESDAGELRALAPSARVVVAPKALEVHPPAPDSGAPRLIFVGSDNAFNIEGLTWFLTEVWPRLKLALPAATLDVCGSIRRAMPAPPEGVILHGVVDSLAPFYEKAALAIVPLRRATGLNIKLVEAAAFGRAIVATPATLTGAPFLRDALIVADSAEEFAGAVQRLLASPVARATAAARVLAAARTHLAPAVCYGPLAALLHQRC